MDFEYDGAEDLGGRILWGRIAVFGAALLLMLLFGRCTAGGGVDASELEAVQTELATAQTELTNRDQTIQTLQARIVELQGEIDTLRGGGLPGTGTDTGTDTGTTTPPAPPGPQVDQVYIVQAGDTLSGIAAQVYGDPTAFGPIATANGITDSNPLQVGQELTIPPNPDS